MDGLLLTEEGPIIYTWIFQLIRETFLTEAGFWMYTKGIW